MQWDILRFARRAEIAQRVIMDEEAFEGIVVRGENFLPVIQDHVNDEVEEAQARPDDH